ncbi:uncharacterized protein HMPREF1541_01931 [Cyphellophora europaea CBS 101466]|uniref:Large ribosomal subunit protein mL49 n=1 Tax=Cyphellophora europaea (strain CBS 101466) TaxID=1220924 RepID=W2S3Z2_CYPE1|nr:uncharacterized protein HMPREF1541_01931 [Cyphellophora europaea CBS 101466]ETN42773.1 hypothetical protein HMPREF1541_01931 [Cyphellophora europaea CBS 101466]
MELRPPVPIDITSASTGNAAAAEAGQTTSPNQLPYLITRTSPGAQLPVYEHAKGGGTKHITVLRKLSGDLEALQQHLRDALGLADGFVDAKGRRKEYISINWTTRQLVVRGWRGAEVRRWCELTGF